MDRIKISSKQIFEKHEDSFSEEHDCEIIFLEDGFKIMYDDGEIIYDGEKVLLKNESTFLEIEEGAKKLASMNTPYGILDIEVTGDRISFKENPFCFEVKYFIKIGDNAPYINELQVLVLNK